MYARLHTCTHTWCGYMRARVCTCRSTPTLLCALCTGVVSRDALLATTSAQSTDYVTPADRYAVVPGGGDEVAAAAAAAALAAAPAVPDADDGSVPAAHPPDAKRLRGA